MSKFDPQLHESVSSLSLEGGPEWKTEWRLENRMLHKRDEPALLTNTIIGWYLFGEPHCIYGPAIIRKESLCEWYLHGVRLSPLSHFLTVKDKSEIEIMKTMYAVYGSRIAEHIYHSALLFGESTLAKRIKAIDSMI